DAGAEVGDALVVLEAGELRQGELLVDVGENVADAAFGGAAGAGDVEEPEARFALAEVVDELVAEDLVAGADGEDDGAVVGGAVEAAVAAQALGGQALRAVLAAADQVDVAGGGNGLVGADVDALDGQAALAGAA